MKNTKLYLSESHASALIKAKETTTSREKKSKPINSKVKVFHASELEELRKNDWKESEENFKNLPSILAEINYKTMEVAN